MTTRSTAIALAGCAALAVAMGIGRFAFTPILPMMQGEGGLDVAQGGWLASANYAGYLAGGLTAMRLRLGARDAVRAGLAAVGVSTLAMGLTHSMAAWLVFRGVAGLASAWVLVFASAWCLEQFQSHATPTRAPLLGAILFAGVGAGIAFAGAACVVLLLAGISAAGAWISLGAVSLVVTALTWNRFADSIGRGTVQAGDASRWSNETVRLVACYGVFGFGYIIPATFLAAMARDALPDPAVYGLSWPLFGAAAAASTLVAAAWRGALSERAMWIAGHGVMAAGVAMPLAVPGVAGIMASALLVGGTFMVVTMAGMQEARRIAGAQAARRVIAAMTSSFAVGQIAGPLVVSFLAARGHGFAPALAIAAAALVASAFALAIRSPQPRTS